MFYITLDTQKHPDLQPASLLTFERRIYTFSRTILVLGIFWPLPLTFKH